MKTYRTFEKYAVLSPEKILDAGWDELDRVLTRNVTVSQRFAE